jgi:DNA-binding protein H-NS
MAKPDRSANDLKKWEQTTTSIAANAPELPQTDIPRAALEKLTEELRKLVVQQKLFQANKQQTSKRIAEIHAEGNRLATILRGLVKQHFGIRNEKLVELGVKPFRGRARKAAPAEPPPPTTGPTPAVPTTPTPPATSLPK